ncbi:hypothetical protein ACQCT3_10670 [Sutcliffiella horikoshii]|uniref:hypothetical protein n=1 Tax=Sutcliffiella horikoshii TaxID=79883 RepID=UPI003CF8B7F1
MKIWKTLGTLTIAGVLLSGCGDDAVNTTSNNGNSPAEEKTEDVAGTSEETKDTTESEVGNRSNPVPFQETMTIQDVIFDDESSSFDATVNVQVLEVIRGEEAWAIISAEIEGGCDRRGDRGPWLLYHGWHDDYFR